MIDDIPARLRRYAKDQGGWHNIDDTCEEAADEIERLRAENERLREALEKIAQHDMQAVAMDALQPGERIREEKKS